MGRLYTKLYARFLINYFGPTSLRVEKYSSSPQKYANPLKHSLEPPWRIMFFGSDDFAVKSLQALCSKLRTETLISKLDVTTTSLVDWSNEKNAVYRYAESEKLTIYNWPIDVFSIDNKYDIGIVVSFGHLIPTDIIESFPLGILNVHGSLLPKWRGAAPIVHAVLHGDSTTGVSIMKINPREFDTGDIVRQYSVSIKSQETASELTNRLAVLGAQLLMECVRNLPHSVLMTVPQSKDGISYAKKVTPSMAIIDWKNKSAKEIHNQYRALSHLFPLKTYWLDATVKLSELFIDDIVDFNPENRKAIQNEGLNENCIIPGLVEFSRKRGILRVQCKDGKWICIRRVIVFGKKTLTAAEFCNGYLSKINKSLDRKFTVNRDER